MSSTEEFSEDRCPLEENRLKGVFSTNSEVVFAGEVRDARNSKEMRIALLCEMVCRASKLLLRFYLRRSARLHGCVVPSIAAPFAIDLLNALTGGHPTADVIWQEEIVPRVNQSYGDRAIDSCRGVYGPDDVVTDIAYLPHTTGQCLVWLTHKLKTLEAFDACPDGFVFVSADLNKSDSSVYSLGACNGARPACQPVVKHGICHLDVARGLLLAHKARQCTGDYNKLVKRHKPPFYLPLDERPGRI